MGALLISRSALLALAGPVRGAVDGHGAPGAQLTFAVLEDCIEAGAQALPEIELAFLSGDVMSGGANPEVNRQLADFLEVVRRAPGLRWLQLCSAGADGAVYRDLMARGVRVTTASGANAVAVAHTALAAMLGLGRGLPSWIESKAARRWSPRWADPPRDLDGARAVVVGLGPVGREISRLCRAFGLHVTGVRRSGQPVAECDDVRSVGELPNALERADWLILACPLTPETKGLIDAAMLARLPAHARLINVARGGIVDETALCAALSAGKLAAAYSDVFAQEPLPPDSPLWHVSNLLMSSHSAGAAQGVQAHVDAIFLRNLERWLAGAPLLNDAALA